MTKMGPPSLSNAHRRIALESGLPKLSIFIVAAQAPLSGSRYAKGLRHMPAEFPEMNRPRPSTAGAMHGSPPSGPYFANCWQRLIHAFLTASASIRDPHEYPES